MKAFFQKVIDRHIEGVPFITSFQSIGGGCINNAARISTHKDNYFLKWNVHSGIQMFEKEASGLILLQDSSNLRIPKVLGQGKYESYSYLLLEWIDKGIQTPSFWKGFGKSLAQMHKVTNSNFGLDHDNFIGSLPQSNKKTQNWIDFFVQERLLPQIRLAEKNNFIDSSIIKMFDHLFPRLESLIPEEPPALLHGDLWSGNFISDSNNNPAVFDPAVHFGHRETELAFTKLFGGFDDAFYSNYNEEYPLSHSFEERIDVHNLYPLLVHVNLFGTSYLSGIIHTLRRFS